jgi:hypothetical protein
LLAIVRGTGKNFDIFSFICFSVRLATHELITVFIRSGI